MTYDGTQFGRWLRQQRKARDLTQRALARQIGCSEFTLRKFEAGTRRPSRQVVELLVRFFGIAADEEQQVIEWARLGTPAESTQTFASSPAPTVARDRPVHNLPSHLTPLIGREQELAAIQAHLGGSAVRLLTLTGPPGVGKTRLAVQAAGNLLPAFPDGVFFVSLALVRDTTMLASIVAQALGLKPPPNQATLSSLASALARQRLLLVLDNFEQVIDAAPGVVRLLEACPQLKVLVTSRQALAVHGEQQLEVPPLPLPDMAAALDELLASPAVALFVERARAVKPDFQFTAENAPTGARICARLDGLPLAIELAASHVRLLSPSDMLARLDHRLSLLTNGARNLPPRHQTLRNAIDWSYDLLRPQERILFARMSVFAGGCTLDAVEAVAGREMTTGRTPGQPASGDQWDHSVVRPQGMLEDGSQATLAVLKSLLDKSLIHEDAGLDGEPRFTMLETIREHAQDHLTRTGLPSGTGETGELQARHAQYYLAWAEETARHLASGGEEIWLDRLEQDHDNLRAALEWALGRGEYEQAARMGIALLRFWDVRGYWSEGRRWLTAILSLKGTLTLTAQMYAQVALGAGRLAAYQDDYEQAQRLVAESLQQSRTAGDQPAVVAALNGLASLAARQGDHATSTQLLEESLAISREIGDRRTIASTLANLGHVATDVGDHDRALRFLREALAVFQQLEDKWGMAGTLESLGQIAAEQGDNDQAIRFLEESLVLSRLVGDKGHLAWVLGDLGIVLLAAGSYIRSLAATEEAMQLFLQLGDQQGRAMSFAMQGVGLAYMGEDERAGASFRQSLRLYLEIGDEAGCALGLGGLAFLAAEANPRRAAHLASAAIRLRGDIGYKVVPVERPLHGQTIARLEALHDIYGVAGSPVPGVAGSPVPGVAGSPEHEVDAILASSQIMELAQALAYAREESLGI